MKLPLVAIIGRPNVGKSTFFNKICGKRISIVKDTPGVTRDRIYAQAEWCGHNFMLVDTGGLQYNDDDSMHAHIRKQAEIAIELCDVILFFVDATEGLVSSDHYIADYLRASKKPVILVVNKLDNFDMNLCYEFYELGLGDPVPISCEQSKGLGDLLDEVVKYFPERLDAQGSEAVKIAVVGKPNVGKSSLVNRLLGFERVIVSDVAGTTRDAIDTPFTYMDKEYVLIDTAGLRRKRSIEEETVEAYSVMRTLSAIERADVVLIVFDATEQISDQDLKIASLVHESGKPSVIVINKWDLIEKDTFTVESFTTRLDIELAFMSYYMPVFVSALTGQRTEKILKTAITAYDNSCRRIPTGLLNDVINEAIRIHEPPAGTGKRIKIMYATQPEINPPTFVFFCNNAENMHFSYKGYLENCIRKSFDFVGTPIKLQFNSRKEEK